jgi:hypothetical protein
VRRDPTTDKQVLRQHVTRKNLNGEGLPIPRGAGYVLKARDYSGPRSRSFHFLCTNYARESIWSAKLPRFEALSRLPGFYGGSAYGALCVGILRWIVQIIQALPFSQIVKLRVRGWSNCQGIPASWGRCLLVRLEIMSTDINLSGKTRKSCGIDAYDLCYFEVFLPGKLT